MTVLPAGNSAHTDGNQNSSLLAVIGTLGTADVGGTALTLPVGVDPSTGALFVNDLAGQSGTNNVKVTSGTVLNTGTNVNVVNVGTFTMTTGTLAAYSFNHQSAAGTTVIKSGAGVLYAFVINAKSVGGVGSLIDGTSTGGSVIAAVDTTLSTTAFVYNANFSSGLTFAWAGNTGGDVTITYR